MVNLYVACFGGLILPWPSLNPDIEEYKQAIDVLHFFVGLVSQLDAVHATLQQSKVVSLVTMQYTGGSLQLSKQGQSSQAFQHQ